MCFRWTRPQWLLRSLHHWEHCSISKSGSMTNLAAAPVEGSKEGDISRCVECIDVLTWSVTSHYEGYKADWTKPGHHTSNPLAEKLTFKLYPADKFLSIFSHVWCPINLQPIWNAWHKGQMISQSLKSKQEKTPFSQRFSSTMKKEEGKRRKTLGEKKSIGNWTKKIGINVSGRK